jgi:hypothetical protein
VTAACNECIEAQLLLPASTVTMSQGSLNRAAYTTGAQYVLLLSHPLQASPSPTALTPPPPPPPWLRL